MNPDKAELTDEAIQCGVPEHIISGIVDYIVNGCPPGDFLMMFLENNLMGASGCADSINIRHFLEISTFLYSYAPLTCWGSPEKVRAWMESRRSQETKAEGGPL